jgi:hypothetical protein
MAYIVSKRNSMCHPKCTLSVQFLPAGDEKEPVFGEIEFWARVAH